MSVYIFIFNFFFIFFMFSQSFAQHDTTAARSSPSTPPPPPPPPLAYQSTPFRPSIAIIIGLLTTLFSITFLLLLYAKHCKHGSVVIYSNHHSAATRPPPRNSGIARTVVESLPLFRFGSLRGQKDRLECAVCLTRFDPTEVLRLLPKCKHAFHVECVDTWLDSHSTCPLCRCRVDPEDILLLLHDVNIFRQSDSQNGQDESGPDTDNPSPVGFHRVSGRHSSAGERGGINNNNINNINNTTSSCRRSLDSVKTLKESVTVGCFDRPRKDGLLLTDNAGAAEDHHQQQQRRFEHRIIVSDGSHKRWSDVQPTDLLYLRSEMIISDSRRFSWGSSRPSVRKQQQQSDNEFNVIEIENDDDNNNRVSSSNSSGTESGRGVMNTRSVSEITGLSRFSGERLKRKRHEGVVSRWVAWMSSQTQAHHNQQQAHVSSDPHAYTSNVV